MEWKVTTQDQQQKDHLRTDSSLNHLVLEVSSMLNVFYLYLILALDYVAVKTQKLFNLCKNCLLVCGMITFRN